MPRSNHLLKETIMTEDHSTLDVTLRIPQRDSAFADLILADTTFDPARFGGAGIDGGGDWMTVVVSLGTASLTAFVATIREHWNRAKHVKIEVDGIKVEGASPNEVERLLEKLLVERKRGKTVTTDDAPKS
jgi:hypothetical protein